MKLYNWKIDCIVDGKHEVVEVQAINNVAVAKAAAILKMTAYPNNKRLVICQQATLGEFVKEFV